MARIARIAGLWALALLGVAAGARAATLTIADDAVAVGEPVVFHIETDQGAWPDGCDGAERHKRLYFSGPCSSVADFGFGNDYGFTLDMSFPGGGWEYGIPCFSVLRPGAYTAVLDYWRRDASCNTATFSTAAVPFTVLAKLEVDVIPGRIPVGDTVVIEVSGVNPGEVVTSIEVHCPNGAVDSVPNPSQYAGFGVSWPGPVFVGACDSSTPGGYRVTVASSLQTAVTGFGVFGDRDGDGWLDRDDNCPTDPNPGQEDADGDDRGDACDWDADNDGVNDDDDNCRAVPNNAQDDLDVDGLGDPCDPDGDEDGVPNETDNCDLHWNPGQENGDGDPFGDACDPDPADTDNDGVSDAVDNCPGLFNPLQQDDDGDGLGSACDPDIDGDGIGNAEEAKAGTHPNDPQPLEVGINEFFDGQAIAAEGGVPEAEPVGVVVNPAADATSVEVTVVDPWGDPYAQQTLIPQSPVAFWFVPIWSGDWRIDADVSNGETYTATVHVIPEPAASLAGIAALVTLAAQRRRRSSSSSRVRGQSSRRSLESARSASSRPSVWQRAQ